MLPPIEATRKTGDEPFIWNERAESVRLRDFWAWCTSDLLSNATRGILAEFIVAMALGQTERVRVEWDAYDLKYQKIKIEVKSSAYIQSWHQKANSIIQFGIRKTRAWGHASGKYAEIKERQADVYVFALLNHKDQNTIDPLNLNQWTFYVLSTTKINAHLPEGEIIGLKTLEQLKPLKCQFAKLKECILSESQIEDID